MCSSENTRKVNQLIYHMICMNYDHNKKFGLLKFHSGYEKFNLNSPKGYILKIINAQTGCNTFPTESHIQGPVSVGSQHFYLFQQKLDAYKEKRDSGVALDKDQQVHVILCQRLCLNLSLKLMIKLTIKYMFVVIRLLIHCCCKIIKCCSVKLFLHSFNSFYYIINDIVLSFKEMKPSYMW